MNNERRKIGVASIYETVENKERSQSLEATTKAKMLNAFTIFSTRQITIYNPPRSECESESRSEGKSDRRAVKSASNMLILGFKCPGSSNKKRALCEMNVNIESADGTRRN